MRAWQALGLVWDEALCAIDMATVLDPVEPDVQAAAERARSILTRLGAKPMLERLESAALRPRKADQRPVGIPVGSEDRTPV